MEAVQAAVAVPTLIRAQRRTLGQTSHKRAGGRHRRALLQPMAAAAHSRKAAAVAAAHQSAQLGAAIRVKLAAVVPVEKTKAAQATKVQAKAEKADRVSLTSRMNRAAEKLAAAVPVEKLKLVAAAQPETGYLRKKSRILSPRPIRPISMQPTAAAPRS